ncbi:MAG TPA: hypothetical protein VN039_05695 [Nitrospira sp.]|nr:hypothetical protein [Nitrospira sp.]
MRLLMGLGWRPDTLYCTAHGKKYRIRFLKHRAVIEYQSDGHWIWWGGSSYAGLRRTEDGCIVAGSLVFGEGRAIGLGKQSKS